MTLTPGVEAPRKALWSRHIGPGWVTGIAFDQAGSVVVSGNVQGRFDASLGVAGAGDPMEPDGFVAQFDRNGRVGWVHRWVSVNGQSTVTPDVAVAATITAGGVSVLGLGSGLIDLGGGTMSVPSSAMGVGTAFWVHYANPSGAFVSAAPLALAPVCGASRCNVLWSEFDDAGDAYALTQVSSASSTQIEVLLTKSNGEGRLLWNVPVSNGSPDTRLAVSSTGMSVVFQSYALTVFGTDGSQLWSRKFDWAAPLGPADFDRAENVVVGGTFAGAIDLGGPAPLQSPAGDSQQPGDTRAQPIFVAKYDAGGHYLWGNAYGSTSRAQSKVGAIRVASDDDVVFTGGFAGAIDFGTGAFRTTSDPEEVGYHDAFLARLGPDGVGRWSDGFAGPGYVDTGSCLALAPDGRVAVGGAFDQTIDFGNGQFTAVGNLGSQFGPNGDGFVAVFAP
jgi:hypothetical protein